MQLIRIKFCVFLHEKSCWGTHRWSISIGIPLYLHTDGDRSYSHLWRNLNQSRFEGVEFTNTPTDQ